MKVVQFFVKDAHPGTRPGESLYALREDGRMYVKFFAADGTEGPWVEISPPNGNVPNVTVTP